MGRGSVRQNKNKFQLIREDLGLSREKAAELLADTDWKVSDIGERCGFREMSYFTKTFRELKGCTPSAYRERKRTGR